MNLVELFKKLAGNILQKGDLYGNQH